MDNTESARHNGWREKMVKKYVLTGGPGSGKSSILLGLEQQGEYVIREAAEDYIRLRQAQGQKEPWTEQDFQDKILELQLQRESKILSGIERVFIDRGILDGLAYYQITGKKPSKQIIKARNKVNQERPYEKIFLIMNLGDCERNDVRRENMEEAFKLENLQEWNYRKLRYNVERIHVAPLDRRVNELMLNVKQNEHDAMKQNRKEENENGNNKYLGKSK